MTQEQKDNMQAAIDAEHTVALVELDPAQQNAMNALQLDSDDMNELAAKGFAQLLRGRVAAKLPPLMRAFHTAHSKGATKKAEKLNAEIGEWNELLESIKD